MITVGIDLLFLNGRCQYYQPEITILKSSFNLSGQVSSEIELNSSESTAVVERAIKKLNSYLNKRSSVGGRRGY